MMTDGGATSATPSRFDMFGYPPARSTIGELLKYDPEARHVIKAWEDEILNDPGFREGLNTNQARAQYIK